MGSNTIDYDSLAKQHGAVGSAPSVDYDALARKHGAVSSAPSAQLVPSHAPSKATPLATGHAPTQFTPEQLRQAAQYRTGIESLDLPGLASMYRDLGVGVLKGAGNTAYNIARLGAIPGIPGAVVQAVAPTAPKQLTPSNPVQKIGYTGEQIGEFLLPTGLEEKAATFVASKLPAIAAKAPMLAKAAVPAARMATAAVETGVRNETQGGDFTSGAVTGAAGSGVTQAAKAVAPAIADKAIGFWKKDRTYGRTPGAALLSETKGVSPAGIADQAEETLRHLDSALDTAAVNSQIPASTNNAVQVVNNALQTAEKQNNADNYRKLIKLRDQLTINSFTGQPLNASTASDMLNLRRGVDDLVTSWNQQETSKTVQSVIKQVRHALGEELHRVAPDTAAIDKRISNLIPVAKRTEEVASSPGVIGDLVEKLRRPTGALAAPAVGALAGGGYGYAKGDPVGGAVKGAAIGFAPTFVAQPGVLLGAARLANSPAVQNGLIPFGKGTFLQAFRKPDGSLDYKIVKVGQP